MSSATLNFESGTYSANGVSYALASVPGLDVAGPTIASYAPNGSGGLTAFAANAPRIVSGEGIFLEQASTNYCCYSLFSSVSLPPTLNSYWQTVDATISYSTAITNPDGSTGCGYFQQSNNYDARAVANEGSIISLSGVANGTQITASVYVIAATPADVGKRTKIYIYDGGFSYTSVVLTASWQRVSVTFSYVSSYGFFFIPAGAEPGGVDVCNMYLWGAQIEVGSIPTSLISTLGSTPVTRSADIATYTYSPAASSAALTTSSNSQSLSPTSPIDFGGDSGGSWLGGFVQSVQVGASGASYTVNLNATADALSADLKGVGHGVKSNGPASSAALKSVAAARSNVGAASASTTKLMAHNGVSVSSPSGYDAHSALHLIGFLSIVMVATVLSVMKVFFRNVLACAGAPQSAIQRTIGELGQSSTIATSTTSKQTSALQSLSAAAASAVAKALTAQRLSTTSPASIVITLKLRFFSVFGGADAASNLSRLTRALHLSDAQPTTSSGKAIQKVGAAAAAPLSAIQNAMSVVRQAIATASTVVGLFQSRSVLLPVTTAPAGLGVKAISADQNGLAGADAVIAKAISAARPLRAGAASSLTKAAAQSILASGFASASTALQESARIVVIIVVGGASAAVEKGAAKVMSATDAAASATSKAMRAIWAAVVAPTGLIQKLAAQTALSVSAPSAAVFQLKFHLVALTAIAISAVRVGRQIAAQKFAESLASATSAKATSKVSHAAAQPLGTSQNSQSADVSLTSVARAAAQVSKTGRIVLAAWSAAFTFLTSVVTQVYFDMTGATYVQGRSRRGAVIGAASRAEIAGQSSSAKIQGKT